MHHLVGGRFIDVFEILIIFCNCDKLRKHIFIIKILVKKHRIFENYAAGKVRK